MISGGDGSKDRWLLYAEAFHSLFGEDRKLELSPAAIHEFAERLLALSAIATIPSELRSALEMLAALADADDARTVEQGCVVPAVHHGDDSAVAWPENRLLRHLKPFLARTLRTSYITMRDAVAARDFLRRADGKADANG